jgi:hypothetical protein
MGKRETKTEKDEKMKIRENKKDMKRTNKHR